MTALTTESRGLLVTVDGLASEGEVTDRLIAAIERAMATARKA